MLLRSLCWEATRILFSENFSGGSFLSMICGFNPEELPKTLKKFGPFSWRRAGLDEGKRYEIEEYDRGLQHTAYAPEIHFRCGPCFGRVLNLVHLDARVTAADYCSETSRKTYFYVACTWGCACGTQNEKQLLLAKAARGEGLHTV